MSQVRLLIGFILLVWVGVVSPVAAQCDATGPVLTGFDFNPKSVDVSVGDQPVTVTFNVTDDLSGVERIGVQFSSPSFVQTVSCNSVTPVSGNSTNGTYQCVALMPRYSESGSWVVDQISFPDRVGRGTGVFTDDLMAAALPFELQVSSVPDIVAPVLTGLTVNPLSIDVSAAPGIVDCNVTATDNLSGISAVICTLTSPTDDVIATCVQPIPGSGTPTNGTFSCPITVAQYSESQVLDLSVQLVDVVDNTFTYMPADLAAGGFPDAVTVTSNPEDLLPPVLLDFDLQPSQVNVENADRTITCSARLTDNLAGASVFGCSGTFIDTNFDILTQACTTLLPDTGTRLDGTWSCDLTIPQYSPGGVWGFVTAIYFDAALNVDFSDSTALALGGFPNTFDVICGTPGSPPGPVLSWATDTLITWLPITGAIGYNLYGGFVSSLVDFDSNGLPDLGYGLCRNAEDGDTTDTLFFDVTTPPSGEVSFLLVGYDTATMQNQGLGTTSGSLDRFPTLPCP